MRAWVDRRRNVATARASRSFATRRSPALEGVLVAERDAAFAAAAREGAREAVRTGVGRAVDRALSDGGNDGAAAAAAALVAKRVVVCVGLAHLDGLAAALGDGAAGA